MSKILITGDIHIWNYADYNLEPDFRLNQFIGLAHRLVEIGKVYDCSHIVLAGDITHKAIIPPKVEHTIKQFFDILNSRWDKDHLLYILGNHDLNSKQAETVFEQSSIPVIADNKATYCHKQIKNINGKSVAFMDWLPKQDLSWIEKQVDLFIGHVTIDPMFGQEIDHSKFKLGIAGDIHRPISLNNIHSTSVPLAHYISDDQEGKVVIYDCETGEFERVKTESINFKHLKIYYEDSKADFNDPYVMKVKKPTKITSATSVYRGIDIDSIIEKTVVGEGLEELHKDYISTLSNLDSKPIDLNFSIKKLRLKNFLSISNLDMELPNGLITLSGANGKGKSSLIKAIDFAFRPPRSVKDYIKLGEKELELEIVFDYKGKTHRIERTYGTQTLVTYSIDGVEQIGGSVAEVNKQIDENLDFLQLFDILYRYQSAPYLLSGFNYAQRIELVSKLLGLGKVDLAYKLIQKDLKLAKDNCSKVELELSNKQAIIEELGSVDLSILSEKESTLNAISQLNEQSQALSSQVQEITAYNQHATENNKKYQEQKSKIEYLKSKVLSDFELSDINSAIVDLSNKVSDGEQLLDKFKDDLNKVADDISKVELEKQKIQLGVDAKKGELNKINLSSKVCSACGREFDNADEIQKHYDQAKFEYEKALSEQVTLNSDLDSQLQNLGTMRNTLSGNIQAINDMLSKFRFEITERQNILNEQSSIKDQLIVLSQNDIIELPLKDSGDLLLKQQEINTQLYPLLDKKAKIDLAEQNKLKLEQHTELLKQLEESLTESKLKYEQLEKYLQLYAPTGSIVKSVFLTVAELLTEDKFVVRTVKTLKNGDTRIDFDVDYKVGNLLIPYQNLSGGQKVIVDIFFMSKLFKMSGQVGLLMLDETLKDLDVDNLERAVRILREAPISTILLVTHVESFNFYDLKYNVDYNDGCSVYKLEGS